MDFTSSAPAWTEKVIHQIVDKSVEKSNNFKVDISGFKAIFFLSNTFFARLCAKHFARLCAKHFSRLRVKFLHACVQNILHACVQNILHACV